ncbi:MAG: sulfotransferase domain-containing protein [Waterburya sp.]
MNKIIESYLQKAEEKKNEKEWDEAIFHYKSAINYKSAIKEPKLYDAYLNLGDCLRHKEDFDGAIKIYNQLMNLKPGYWQVYSRLERLVESQNISKYQLEQIVEIVKKSLEDDPDNTQNQTTLIYALSCLEKSEEAKEVCQKITYKNNLIKDSEFVKNYWDKNQSNLGKPNFVIVGFMKCGTTSLYDYISQHPKILPACRKEIMYFNNKILNKLDIDWYQANFPYIPDNSGYITGEASTLYVQYKSAAERLYKYFPNTKIIIVIRDPVARSISHYFFMKKLGYNIPPFEDLIKESIIEIDNMKDINNGIDGKIGIITSSLYSFYIKNWVELFGKDKILIVNAKTLSSRVNFALNRIYEFLDVSSYEIFEKDMKNVGEYNESIDSEVVSKLSVFFNKYNDEQMLSELDVV